MLNPGNVLGNILGRNKMRIKSPVMKIPSLNRDRFSKNGYEDWSKVEGGEEGEYYGPDYEGKDQYKSRRKHAIREREEVSRQKTLAHEKLRKQYPGMFTYEAYTEDRVPEYTVSREEIPMKKYKNISKLNLNVSKSEYHNSPDIHKTSPMINAGRLQYPNIVMTKIHGTKRIGSSGDNYQYEVIAETKQRENPIDIEKEQKRRMIKNL